MIPAREKYFITVSRKHFLLERESALTSADESIIQTVMVASKYAPVVIIIELSKIVILSSLSRTYN